MANVCSRGGLRSSVARSERACLAFLCGRLCSLVSLLLTALLLAPATKADDATTDAGGSRPLVIAIGQDFRPFQFVDAAGKPAGLAVDLWRLWSEKTGTPIELKAAPWAESLEMVRDGRADVHAGLGLTSERRDYLDYGDPLLSTDSFLFSPVGVQVKGSIDDLVGFRIGVLKGSLEESVLGDRVPGAELLAFDTVEALYDAVAANRVRLFADIEQTALYFLGERDLQSKFRFDPATPLDSNYLFAAVGKNKAGLLKMINTGLKAISAEERAGITRRWLGRTSETESEKLIVAIPRNYPPLSMIDSTGRPAGMLIDIWRLWAGRRPAARSSSGRAVGPTLFTPLRTARPTSIPDYSAATSAPSGSRSRNRSTRSSPASTTGRRTPRPVFTTIWPGDGSESFSVTFRKRFCVRATRRPRSFHCWTTRNSWMPWRPAKST